MTRTGWTFAGATGWPPTGRAPRGGGRPAGAVAFAMPMNVAGDNMRRSLNCRS
jgi:hypothetical protein